jgi:hypothetical protein
MAMQKRTFPYLTSIKLDIDSWQYDLFRCHVSLLTPLDTTAVLFVAAHCPNLRQFTYVMRASKHIDIPGSGAQVGNLFDAFGTLATSCKALEVLKTYYIDAGLLAKFLAFTMSLGAHNNGGDVVTWLKETLGKALEEYVDLLEVVYEGLSRSLMG